MLKVHEKIKGDTWYAGGVWTWDGFSTQNRYSMEALKNSLEACRECGVENLIITTWGDGGAECSVYEALPTILFAAEYVNGNTDMDRIKERFSELFGIGFDEFMLFDQVMKEETEAFYLSPSKYLLYNDPFIGLLDTTIPESCKEDFTHLCNLTLPLTEHERWGYLFKTNHLLCHAVAEKCDIGIRIRKAYRENDTDKLRECAAELRKIKDQVHEFYLAFEKQWMTENKAYGFEIHDVRLGGLMTRLMHCADRLGGYVNGDSAAIDELEDEPLDVRGTRDNLTHGRRYIRYNKWPEIISAGNLAIHR
jgi:hypothetical protein